jgi:hypothetical protein
MGIVAETCPLKAAGLLERFTIVIMLLTDTILVLFFHHIPEVNQPMILYVFLDLGAFYSAKFFKEFDIL